MIVFNPYTPPYLRASDTVERATTWLDEHGDRPFFMFLNFLDAHLPYVPVPEFDQRFAARPAEVEWVGFPDDHEQIAQGKRTMSAAELNYLQGQYDAELLYLDQQLSILMRHLKNAGLYDDSLVMIVSDHGEGFLEHGYLRHGVSLYEPEVSVPLMIKLPDSFHGAAPESLTHFQFIDIFPTVTNLLGIGAPDSVQGAAWGGDRDYAIAENFCLFRNIETLKRELFAVRIDDWKYIASTEGTEEAYDLTVDPEESNDIFGTRPEYEDMARRIHAAHLSTYHQRPAQGGQGDSMIEKLKALGYVD